MLWMIGLCALSPLLIVAFAEGLVPSRYILPLAIGGMVVAHLVMMFKGHGGDADDGGSGHRVKKGHHSCH